MSDGAAVTLRNTHPSQGPATDVTSPQCTLEYWNIGAGGPIDVGLRLFTGRMARLRNLAQRHALSLRELMEIFLVSICVIASAARG